LWHRMQNIWRISCASPREYFASRKPPLLISQGMALDTEANMLYISDRHAIRQLPIARATGVPTGSMRFPLRFTGKRGFTDALNPNVGGVQI
jgi:hypothetical protein